MPILPPATATALAERARQLLRDAADLTSGRDPNYIRDAEPESIFEALPLAAARQGCRRYADNPGEYSGRRQARVERACRPYLDNIGYGEPPEIELPFRGGQCAAKYIVGFTLDPSFPGQSTGTILVVGPVRGIREETQSNGSRRVFLQANSGGVFSGECSNVVNPTGPQDIFLGSYTPSGPGSARINFLTPCSGDDCGNPDPIIFPPKPPSTPGPTREPFTRVPDIDVDIEVTVNPDLTIDIDFGVGPVTIDPFGDDDGGGGTGGPGTPGSPEGTGLGGDAEGEAPEGQVLTGLRISFVEPPIGGKEYAPGVYRGVCYIYMGTPDGLDHDPAGAMLRDGQFVYAEKDYLTRWLVTANMGYNLLVTPFYRPAEAEE